MNFDDAFARVIGVEGRYSNNPADPGGETMWGITKRVAVASGYSGPMRDMPIQEAKLIYEGKFWEFIGADAYPFAIGYQVFDAAVNHGTQQAAKLLQGAVGVTADGVVGPKTQTAIKALGPIAVVNRFIAARLRFYGTLITFTSFGKGWTTNRVPTLLEYAASDLST